MSGDFYWFHADGTRSMIAAVDCTGHGVPGAFMSIVGNNQLNHAVNVTKAIQSDDILNDLNRGVINTLNEHSHESKVMDGMDMHLFNRENDRFSFRANNLDGIHQDGELTQYRVQSFWQGAYEGRSQVFTRVELDLEKGGGDLYLPDGYADRPGPGWHYQEVQATSAGYTW
ncbi:MAG: hypothetical protein R2727_06695 [Bacteroidales bacterium]